MSSLEVRVSTKGLDDLVRTEPEKVDRWLRGVAIQMVGDIKLSFGSGPAGRSYKRGGKYHIASSPGNPPNSDTGHLAGSIDMRSSGNLEYTISDGWEYGELQEYGTAHIAARPFMGPVFAAWQQRIEQDAKENLDLE